MGWMTDGYKVKGAWQCVVGAACAIFASLKVGLLGSVSLLFIAVGIVLSVIGIRKTWSVSTLWKVGDVAVVIILLVGIAGVLPAL